MLRSHRRRAAALLVAVLAVTAMGGAAGQWAWKDDNGRVVYSDRPPPPSVKAARILRQPGVAPVGLAGAGEAPAEAPRPAAPAAQKTVAERELDFRKRAQERAEADRKAQDEQQRNAAKAAECERARGHLRALEDGMRIQRTDAAGNREYLDDNQRAAETERTRRIVQSACS